LALKLLEMILVQVQNHFKLNSKLKFNYPADNISHLWFNNKIGNIFSFFSNLIQRLNKAYDQDCIT